MNYKKSVRTTKKIIKFLPISLIKTTLFPPSDEIKVKPRNLKGADTIFHKAEEAFQNNEYKKTIALLNSILKKECSHYTNAEKYFLIAYSYLKLSNYKKSSEYFKKAIELDPENPIYIMRLGELYALKGDFKKAKNLYNKAVKLDPTNPTLYNNRGFFYHLYDENKDLALQNYLKAVQICENDNLHRDVLITTYYNLSILYETLDKKSLADHYYNLYSTCNKIL